MIQEEKATAPLETLMDELEERQGPRRRELEKQLETAMERDGWGKHSPEYYESREAKMANSNRIRFLEKVINSAMAAEYLLLAERDSVEVERMISTPYLICHRYPIARETLLNWSQLLNVFY